ncbi:MAG: hypothetical protein EOR88_09705 [Mesorhizobium sp.]|nr:MAG: hypothetical protein EOR87_14860 [Mesorhizobium sp.]RWN19419.1 MAG: hypothetical protein EOR88_09705 [Mesorhizobium sp.]
MSMPADIDDDTPIRLQEACDRFFGGRLTPKALRAEARKGNLTIEQIANKDFVTPAAIREMREKCRVAKVRPASSRASTAMASSGSSSGTGPFTAERDALLAKLKARRKSSRNTSPKKGKSQSASNVVPITSRAQPR